MARERKLPARKKVGPFNIDTMLPGTRRRAEEENRRIRSRNIANAMSSSKDIPRRRRSTSTTDSVKDEPVKRIARRGRGTGRTRGTRMDDLEQVRDRRRPQGVTSPIKDAAKPAKTPTAAPSAPKADAAKAKNDMRLPASGLAKVTGKDKKPGIRRNVGSGREKKANVTREQLQKTGLILRDYLNFMDKNNRRPTTKADAAEAKAITEGFKKKKAVKKAGGGMKMKSKMKAKGYKAGGVKSKMSTKGGMAGGKKRPPGMMGGGMKSKMSTKGGAMGGKKKPPGMAVGGLKPAPEGNKGKGLKKLPKEVRNKMGFMQAGGMKKPKGYANGGKKSKGYAKGGMKSKMATKKKATKQKVRGAGIARKGVRPAKMR